MIDIDRIFDSQNSTGNLDEKINISNPILYIFVGGDGTSILKYIYDFNQSKGLNATGAVEYINIGSEVCDFINNNNLILQQCDEQNFIKRYSTIYDEFDRYDEILKMVSYIELKFLEHSYTMPIRRRVHFIVECGNEYSCIVKKVIDTVSDFLLSRNLAPIIDIFAIIDDKPDNTEIQKASTYLLLKELDNIKEYENKNINMIYLLSNINSMRMIAKPEQIYTSIARTALVKEFDYKQQPYDFSYDEGRIIENAKNIPKDKRGNFYSIGLKTIELPKDALQFVALSILIDNNNPVNNDVVDELANQCINEFLQILDNILKNPLNNSSFLEMENIIGVMTDTKASYEQCDTNMDVISIFFGNQLDKYFEYNSMNNLSFDIHIAENYLNSKFKEFVTDKNIGYFIADSILKSIKSKLELIKEDFIKSDYEMNIKFDNWKSQIFVYKKKLFEDRYQPAFNIANQYISYLYKNFIPFTLLKIFENFETELKNMLNINDKLNLEIQISQKKLLDTVKNRLSDKSDILIRINFIDYYSNVVKTYIHDNYSQYFEKIYSKIYDIGKKDINLFYTECVKYINEFILKQAGFNLNVYDEIKNRLLADASGEYDEHSINDLFNKEITDSRFYFIKLINENNFYSNICVLTDNNSVIEKISNSDINYIVYNGDSKLEILYFIGTFASDSLSFFSSYKKSYENLYGVQQDLTINDF